MRTNIASIDLDAIAFNLKQVKKRVKPAKVMAVVKANAYGHGVVRVAGRLIKEGIDYLAVARVGEGIELRESGIKVPILIFGGFFPNQISLFLKHNLELTLFSLENLKNLSQAATETGIRPKVHIKVDTGMGRIGLPFEQADDFIRQVYECENVELAGLYSHFATSDEKDKTFANLQLQRFTELIERLEKSGIKIVLKHIANSGAILDMANSYLDIVRPGIMLYGYYPSTQTTESLPLNPAMILKSRVISVKKFSPGDSVSYGRKFIAKKKRTRIATIPLGYGDGYNRLLTNQGFVSIRGGVFPVVGRVCMDQIMVNIGLDTDIKMGDEVVLFGPDFGKKVSVGYICKKLRTIPYEVCCAVSNRIPRVFTNGGTIDEETSRRLTLKVK